MLSTLSGGNGNYSRNDKERVYGHGDKGKEYIAAGDIFQANLSHRIYAHIGETSPWTFTGYSGR